MLNTDPKAGEKLINFGIQHNLNCNDIRRFWGSIEPPTRISESRIFHDFSMGAFSYISGGFFYHSHIGRYCSFANQIHMGQGNHPMNWLSTHPFQYQKAIFNVNKHFEFYQEYNEDKELNIVAPKELKPSKTIVGNDCWIGTGAYIKNGVTIGSGAVVGARSVVTKDLPPYSISVGSPAKIIKYRFSDSIIHKLMEIEWWHYAPWQLRHVDFSNIEIAIEQIINLRSLNTPRYTPKALAIQR